jgi:hypothetical protein
MLDTRKNVVVDHGWHRHFDNFFIGLSLACFRRGLIKSPGSDVDGVREKLLGERRCRTSQRPTSRDSCRTWLREKQQQTSKRASEAGRSFGAARAPLPVPLGFWAASSPMPSIAESGAAGQRTLIEACRLQDGTESYPPQCWSVAGSE